MYAYKKNFYQNVIHSCGYSSSIWLTVCVDRKNNSVHIVPSAEVKPYLKDHYLSKRITDLDLLTLSALPHGLGQQEWIATNSEYSKTQTKYKTLMPETIIFEQSR